RDAYPEHAKGRAWRGFRSASPSARAVQSGWLAGRTERLRAWGLPPRRLRTRGDDFYGCAKLDPKLSSLWAPCLAGGSTFQTSYSATVMEYEDERRCTRQACSDCPICVDIQGSIGRQYRGR